MVSLVTHVKFQKNQSPTFRESFNLSEVLTDLQKKRITYKIRWSSKKHVTQIEFTDTPQPQCIVTIVGGEPVVSAARTRVDKILCAEEVRAPKGIVTPA